MNIMIRAIALAAVLAVAGTSVVVAQSDPIAARKAAMKAVGAATGATARMAKGEAPFNLDEAKKTFQLYVNTAKAAPALFPTTSKTGGETTAAPKIWEDAAGFTAAWAKWEKESAEALASVKDLASLQAAMGTVTKNCGGCHEVFRIKK
jgi:cytochrome c556